LICNYVDDYSDIAQKQKQELIAQNAQRILSWQKKVYLSSRSVNISIECLSELQKQKLPEMFVHEAGVKAVIFAYDLCAMHSLQSVRKWYKQCCKCSESSASHHAFISILVGTNYERFKAQQANERISVIEQSRKYARKMSAILVFIATANRQQINIKEVFLLILSKVFYFDSNVQAISNSKLPIIEFYDHIVHRKHAKRKTENIHLHSNQLEQQHQLQRSSKKQNRTNDHNRTKTSIEDIQNRLTVIRNNLNSKHRSYDSHGSQPRRAEQLYDRFETQYASFMKRQIHNSQPSQREQPRAPQEAETSMYPSFLHSPPQESKSQEAAEQEQSLSQLLENDALGLHSLHQEDAEPEEEKKEELNSSRRKQQKHERALTISSSISSAITHRSNGAAAVHLNHVQRVAHGQNAHVRAMPSMPNFLSKLQSDSQLKTIITSVFNQSNPKAVQPRVPAQVQAAPTQNIHALQHKITSLESRLSSYQQLIRETNQTVKMLKKTISKIESQRDDANKQIEALMKQQNKESEILQLRNKNVELQSLAEALSVNLARKEQSLEEALNAIHSLNAEVEQAEEPAVPAAAGPTLVARHSVERSKSADQPDSEESKGNKGIMRKLRSLSSSLTNIDLKNL